MAKNNERGFLYVLYGDKTQLFTNQSVQGPLDPIYIIKIDYFIESAS